MQSPLPQLTTILLLVHLGLGCCMHHSHACQWGSCQLDGRCRSFEDFEIAGHAHAASREQHSHSPVAVAVRREVDEPVGVAHEGHHSHECSGEDCTFLAVRARLVSHIEEASHVSSLETQTPGHAAIVSRDALSAAGTARELAGTSLPRTHLTLQVLQL